MTETAHYGWIEMVLVFAIVMGWALSEWRSLARARRETAERAARQAALAAAEPPAPSPGASAPDPR